MASRLQFVVGVLLLCWSLLLHCQLQKQIGKQELHGSTMEYGPLRRLHSIHLYTILIQTTQQQTSTRVILCHSPRLVVLRDGLEVIKQEVNSCAKEVV